MQHVSPTHRTVWVFLEPSSQALGVINVMARNFYDFSFSRDWAVTDTAVLGGLVICPFHQWYYFEGEWLILIGDILCQTHYQCIHLEIILLLYILTYNVAWVTIRWLFLFIESCAYSYVFLEQKCRVEQFALWAFRELSAHTFLKVLGI